MAASACEGGAGAHRCKDTHGVHAADLHDTHLQTVTVCSTASAMQQTKPQTPNPNPNHQTPNPKHRTMQFGFFVEWLIKLEEDKRSRDNINHIHHPSSWRAFSRQNLPGVSARTVRRCQSAARQPRSLCPLGTGSSGLEFGVWGLGFGVWGLELNLIEAVADKATPVALLLTDPLPCVPAIVVT